MNEIALVTGASEGIGKEIAKELETARKGPIWLCPMDLIDKEALEDLFNRKLSSVYGLKNTFTSILNKLATRKMTAHISYNLVKERK